MEKIAAHIRMYKPHTLVCMVKLAKIQADQFARQKWSNRGFMSHGQGPPGFEQSLTGLNKGSNCVGKGASPRTSTKKLNEAEMVAKRVKGFCYNCDDKFVLGHRCRWH